ncbi:endo-1,4-beta-xylanase [Arcticibacterium luteifluviistationis]|uniref:Beta-xylanase n=1 Tax=Arcticibacterium luteifluviistationis TaxID=1784714 RepID=A0A2Z4GHK2_9BACT|nr:endo-1,4-beta-xylanase [Arcticibacterium luteifluviistationis]AWW00409.1 1,4-beta-xylanase [Arcticibacterium luteifluviistationis]
MKLKVLVLAAASLIACNSSKDKAGPVAIDGPDPIKTRLREAYKDDFYIGAALNSSQISESDTKQAGLIALQFNSVTAENAMKSSQIHPSENVYNFEVPDKLAALAEKHDMAFHGHTLVWHSQLSSFINDITDSTKMANALKAHIEAVAGRYKGKTYSWDVVNEAVEGDGSLRESVFLKAMGEDYLSFAFKTAAAVDPNADLYYNDYSMTGAQKRAGVIKMIKKIQASGAKIDGIGMQGHWGLEYPSILEIETSIEQYAALGLKIAITELDIDVLPNPDGVSGADISQSAELKAEYNPYVDGLPDDIAEKQAKRYADLFALFLKHKDKIDRVTFWGVNDGESWKNNFPVNGRTNYPLLFDRDNKKKKAFEAIMALKN